MTRQAHRSWARRLSPSRPRTAVLGWAAAQALSGAWLISLASPLRAGETAEEQATVLSIGDGDTLRVKQGERAITVRLACIDAPEMAQSPWGANSRASLRARLPIGSVVNLRVQTIDRYGRSVAEVLSETNIGLAMVEDGEAFAYRQYLRQCDRHAYLEAELRARSSRLGIWQVSEGISRPWDVRRHHHAAPLADGSTPDGVRYRCAEIGSYSRAQELLQQGHAYLDADGNGKACESLR